MKRLTLEYQNKDARRTLTQLLTADIVPIKQVNIYEANYGAVLGNHFHKETIEYFYIVKGVLLYNEIDYVRKGDLFLVYPPTKHTLKVISDKATFLTFLTRPYTKLNPDTWK